MGVPLLEVVELLAGQGAIPSIADDLLLEILGVEEAIDVVDEVDPLLVDVDGQPIQQVGWVVSESIFLIVDVGAEFAAVGECFFHLQLVALALALDPQLNCLFILEVFGL